MWLPYPPTQMASSRISGSELKISLLEPETFNKLVADIVPLGHTESLQPVLTVTLFSIVT